MKKILYCSNEPLRIKFLPRSIFITSSNIKDAYLKKFPVVIFDEDFLVKNTLNFSLLKQKICLINFKKENKKNIEIFKKYDFFDYFTDEDDKETISLKFRQIDKFLNLQKKINKAEKTLLYKDKKFKKISTIDPLTGIYNWRYFLNRANQELSRSRRQLSSVSFLVIDIDNFRSVNELYGVRISDKIIKEIVVILKKNLRKEDVITRWREDEFFIIFPYQAKDVTYKIASRIKDIISSHIFSYKNLKLQIKVSIGIVSYPEDNIFSSKDIINALEKSLIDIKRKGGDAILFYSDSKKESYLQKEPTNVNIDDLKNKLNKLNNLLTRDVLEMIYGFAKMIEIKDSYTGKHVEDTTLLAEKIAKKLNLSQSEIENIKQAAILHDLGKIGINEKILSKKTALNKKEKEIIKSHPLIAAEILKEIHSLKGAIPAILYHHERYDGKGYPIGLKGNEIPISARIVAIADVFEALISNRPYRKAFSKEKAIEIIKSQSGKQFDPKIVEVFLKVVEED